MIFSCIVPAYNEGSRIANILSMLLACTDLDEVIVINDGSTDNTWEVIQSFDHPKLQKINLIKNEGKIRAFFSGIAHASGDTIVMMDADYSGFRIDHMQQLIEPVREHRVDMTMMMWQESLLICKWLKHDIFSGARVLPKSVFSDTAYFLSGYGYGLEAKMNEVIFQKKLSMLSLYFSEVSNPSKGNTQLQKQFLEIIRSVSFWRIVRQAWYFYKQQP